jgi:hypothetical protein
MFGDYYKKLYEQEKARTERLELQLRQLNELIRTESLRNLSEANRALKIAAETIETLRRGRNNDAESG